MGLKGRTLLVLQDLLKPYSAYASSNVTTCQRVGMFQQHQLWKLPLHVHTSYRPCNKKWVDFKNSSNKHTFYVGITLSCSMPIIPWLLIGEMDTLTFVNLTKPCGYHKHTHVRYHISLLSKYMVWACLPIPPWPPPPFHQQPKYTIKLPKTLHVFAAQT